MQVDLPDPTIKDIFLQNKAIFEQLQLVNNRFDDISNRVSMLEKENNVLRNSLQKLNKSVSFMETELCNKFINLNFFTIHEIPSLEGENLEFYAIKIAEILNIKLVGEDIIKCYRIKSNNTKSTVIIAELKNASIVNNIIQNYKTNGPLFLHQLTNKTMDENSKIFINNYFNRITKQLFDKTKKLQKSYGLKYVWIQNEVILVRKTENAKQTTKIKNSNDIFKLEDSLRQQEKR